MKLTNKQYYLLSFTWGFIITIIGCFVSMILLTLGLKPKKNQYGWYFDIGGDWGGLSLGPCAITSHKPSKYLLNHEYGHSIQNCIFGPFFIVLVLIPSGIRYWYRRIFNITYPLYDSIWFEKQATYLGSL